MLLVVTDSHHPLVGSVPPDRGTSCKITMVYFNLEHSDDPPNLSEMGWIRLGWIIVERTEQNTADQVDWGRWVGAEQIKQSKEE